MLCVTHRTASDERCASCERAFDNHLASKRKCPKGGADEVNTILQLVGVIVTILVVSNIHWGFLPVGIYITAIMGAPASESPRRLRRRERKRFLAEKLD
jgi:hypothetical protein